MAKKPTGKTKPKLTVKQKMFVQEYLIDLNATQAAIRAGYSEKSAKEIGRENLTKPNIKVLIDKAIEERSQRTQITSDKVLEELGHIGFSDIADALSWDEVECVPNKAYDPEDLSSSPFIIRGGVHAIPSKELPPEIRRAIMSVKQNGDGTFEVKMHPKIKALELIGRHLKMFTDLVELKGDLAQEILKARARVKQKQQEDEDDGS